MELKSDEMMSDFEEKCAYDLFIKYAKAFKNFGHYRRPSGYISALHIGLQLIEVPNDHEAQPKLHQQSNHEMLKGAYKISRLEASSLFFVCSGRLSEAIRNRTLTKVAALLDSCFKRFGGCRINPSCLVNNTQIYKKR